MRMSTSDLIGYSGGHYGRRVDKDIERENKKLNFTDLSLVLKWPFGAVYKLGNDVSSGQIESPRVHNLAHTVKVAYLSLLSAFGTMNDTVIFGRLGHEDSYQSAAPSFS